MLLDQLLVGAAIAACATAAPPGSSPGVDNTDWSWRSNRIAPTDSETGWKPWCSSASGQVCEHSVSRTTSSPASYQSATTITSASLPASSANPTEPCESVAQLAAAFTSAQPSAFPTVPAQLAYECLLSIPFNQSAAEQYLNSFDPYINWQTTLEYLKEPPPDYAEKVQPAYDFAATWAEIKANTSANAYQNEHEFGWTVYRAAQLSHDGHFVFYPDSITSIFSFGRSFPLVSVSMDGVSDPRPYLYSDIVAYLNQSRSFTPSPVVEINGQDAVEFLLAWSQYGSLQDPDALWNNLFWIPAQVALGSLGAGTGIFNGGGRGRWPYPGPSTSLSFENGSTVTQENHANVLVPFDNITSGADVYANFLIPPPEAYQNAFQNASSIAAAASTSSVSSTSSTAASSSASSMSSTSVPAPAYPTPFVSTADNENSGYFIDQPGYEDVAVLALRTFVALDGVEIPFQSVNTYFIETAAALGKTKLIIDVSANGGGIILEGIDLFKQLFPSSDPYEANRYRAHEAINLLGEQASYLAGLVPRSLDDNDTYQEIESSSYNYRTDTDVNGQPFNSWTEKYGPDTLGPQPDNFTSLFRWNLSDVLTPLQGGGIYVSGYLNRTNITVQPFAPENIVIVTDGYCASTCSIFAELMTQQGGVKTVALGGRPGGGITQAVGGVKGTEDSEMEYIFKDIVAIYGSSNSSLQNDWQDSVLSQYTALPFYRSTAAVVNVRNGYRQGDASQTPLQFIYEPADCRILYTPAMVVDETAVWKTVADSMWGGGAGNACVAGGFGEESRKRNSDIGSSFVATDGHEKRQLHMPRTGIDYGAIIDSLSAQNDIVVGKRREHPIMIP